MKLFGYELYFELRSELHHYYAGDTSEYRRTDMWFNLTITPRDQVDTREQTHVSFVRHFYLFKVDRGLRPIRKPQTFTAEEVAQFQEQFKNLGVKKPNPDTQ